MLALRPIGATTGLLPGGIEASLAMEAGSVICAAMDTVTKRLPHKTARKLPAIDGRKIICGPDLVDYALDR